MRPTKTKIVWSFTEKVSQPLLQFTVGKENEVSEPGPSFSVERSTLSLTTIQEERRSTLGFRSPSADLYGDGIGLLCCMARLGGGEAPVRCEQGAKVSPRPI